MKPNKENNENGTRNKFSVPYFLIFSLIIILLSSINVLSSYETLGKDGTFYIGETNFNSNVIDQVTGIKPLLNTVTQPARVSDLNNDGIQEIIFLDGKTITIYQNKTLDTVTGTTITASSSVLSNMEIFDIDGDGTKEILIASGDKEIYIYSFNNTLSLDSTLTITFASYSSGSIYIKCRDTQECVWVANALDSRTSTDFRLGTFNSTSGTIASFNIETTTNTNEFTCFSRIPQIQTGNMDNEGDDEYILSYVYSNIAGSEILKVASIFVNNSDASDIQLDWKTNILTNGFSNEQTCNSGDYPNLISSVLVNDFYKGNGDTDEVVVAYQLATQDEFNIKVLTPRGGVLDTYPQLFDSDGIIYSNPFTANIYEDTELEDFCVIGSDQVNNRLSILCGSIESSTIGGLEFRYSTPYNISLIDGTYPLLSHSVEAIDGDERTEILTTYGILNPDLDSCNILNVCDADLIYSMPKINGTAIMSNIDNVRGDIILNTPTNLYFIDDSQINEGAEIINYSINPCLSSSWLKNTSVGINVEVYDEAGDLVNARVILYYGDSNEMDSGWSANLTSGTNIPFSFTANKTISNGNIRIMARDNNNPSDIHTIDRTFSVSRLTGVSFDDCISYIQPSEIKGDEDSEDDILDDAVDELIDTSGLNITRSSFWLSLMLIVAVVIIIGLLKYGTDIFSIALILGIVEGLLLLIGTYKGYISPGYLIFVLIIMIFVIVIKVNPFKNGGVN